MGMVVPLADMARSGDDGLGAYTAGLLFALAALASTFVCAPFVITFPVHGAPVQLRAYFKGTLAQHCYGLLAGALWSAGLIAAFASGGATLATIQAGPMATRASAAGVTVLATLWGLLVWREFRGGSYRIYILLTAMLVAWVVGAGMVAVASGLAK